MLKILKICIIILLFLLIHKGNNIHNVNMYHLVEKQSYDHNYMVEKEDVRYDIRDSKEQTDIYNKYQLRNTSVIILGY